MCTISVPLGNILKSSIFQKRAFYNRFEFVHWDTNPNLYSSLHLPRFVNFSKTYHFIQFEKRTFLKSVSFSTVWKPCSFVLFQKRTFSYNFKNIPFCTISKNTFSSNFENRTFSYNLKSVPFLTVWIAYFFVLFQKRIFSYYFKKYFFVQLWKSYLFRTISKTYLFVLFKKKYFSVKFENRTFSYYFNFCILLLEREKERSESNTNPCYWPSFLVVPVLWNELLVVVYVDVVERLSWRCIGDVPH